MLQVLQVLVLATNSDSVLHSQLARRLSISPLRMLVTACHIKPSRADALCLQAVHSPHQNGSGPAGPPQASMRTSPQQAAGQWPAHMHHRSSDSSRSADWGLHGADNGQGAAAAAAAAGNGACAVHASA